MEIMASGPITSWEIDGETVETVSDFVFWIPKSRQMLTAAMISFRMDWLNLAVKGLSRVFSNTTVQSINSWRSTFFTVQLSHPYMTNGKTRALTRWTFVGKVISLIFNTNSRKQQLELDMEQQTGSK